MIFTASALKSWPSDQCQREKQKLALFCQASGYLPEVALGSSHQWELAEIPEQN